MLDGFGTSASAFGIAAARRNGRFDHAYTLSAQVAAASWTLPDGTALAPRVLSHAAAAPYLGETALMYFHPVQPAAGVPIVTGGPRTIRFLLDTPQCARACGGFTCCAPARILAFFSTVLTITVFDRHSLRH